MALLWFDGFETYDNGTDMGRVSNYDYTSIEGVGTAYGRRGSSGIYQTNDRYCAVALPTQPTTVIVGLAIYLNDPDVPTYATSFPMIAFLDMWEGGVRHVGIFPNGSRNIDVRDNAGTILGTSSGITLDAYVWFYVEVKVVISDTVGQVVININETEVLSTSADKDTLNGSNAYCGSVRIGQCGRQITWWDDFYVCDDSGSKNNDFLGDVRIDVVRPDGAGAYTDFTPSAGSNYQNVDDSQGPDDDSTYNDGASIGNQDSYALGDLSSPAGTTIHGVKPQITVRKTDAGAMEAKILTRAGITDDLGDAILLSDSFTTHTKILEDNPDDSAAWEDADVNGMEVGVEVTA